MIVYLDVSALVKRYIAEAGSVQVDNLIGQSDVVGTSVISRAEVAAALAKAARMGTVSRDEAGAALRVFMSQWDDFLRLQLTESIVARAGGLAWEHGLRGYDAVHLGVALFWQEMIGEPITLATFDRQLWHKSDLTGLLVWPEDLHRFTSL